RADRFRETDPEQALNILEEAESKVLASELPEVAVKPLTKAIVRSKAMTETSLKQRKPNIDLQKRNQLVKDDVKKEIEHKIRVEHDFAELVDQFNRLLDEHRYGEASVIAKKAKELNPTAPQAEAMLWKAKIAGRVYSNEDLKDAKEESFWKQLDDVEWALVVDVNDDKPMHYDAKRWSDLSKKRTKDKYGPSNRQKSPQEKEIERSLNRDVTLNFNEEPLQSVVQQLAEQMGINIHLDQSGLDEASVNPDTPISIHVEQIQLKSALNLMLEQYKLGYLIDNQVLKITSLSRRAGKMMVETYSVADLVIPIPNFGGPINTYGGSSGILSAGGSNGYITSNGAQRQPISGQAFAQIPDDFGMGLPQNGVGGRGSNGNAPPAPSRNDFDSLISLIVSTIEPASWDEVGGEGKIESIDQTLSLVIRQTQAVHEEIVDLL
ncbi:MAG: hypothetical protein KDA68_23695, partial [Planctomycetaceae bacterium]|nr:hypothetical protein [Planctomycetaceae bacterium]